MALDGLGRNIEIDNPEKLYQAMLKPPTNQVKNSDVKKENLSSLVKEIKDILSKNLGFNKEFDAILKLVEQVASFDKSKKKEPLTAKSVFTKPLSNKFKKFIDAGLKKGSIHTSDDKLHKIIKNSQDALENVVNAPQGKKENKTHIPGQRGKYEHQPADYGYYYSEHQVAGEAERYLNLISNKFAKLGLGNVFDGALEGELLYLKNMKLIAYQTQGINGDMVILQKQFLNLDDTVQYTGRNRQEFQEQYMKMFQRGIRDQKTAYKLTLGSLNLATSIGVESGETAQIYEDWYQQLKLSDVVLGDISRGIKDVMRYSGLTGDELIGVVKSSEQFIKNLRNAGNASSMAIKNIIAINAEAKKLGIEQEITPLLEAATSPTKLLDAASEVQGFWFQVASSVGKVDELMLGTLLNTKQGMKKAADGMENLLRTVSGRSIQEIDKLSDFEKRNVNLTLKSFGTSLGEIKLAYEALSNSGKTFSDRLAEIEKQRKSGVKTTEEYMKLAKEEMDLRMSKGQEAISILDKAINQGIQPKLTTEQIIEFQEFTGTKEEDPTRLLEKAANKQAQLLIKANGKDFTEQLKMFQGNSRAIREVFSEMTKEQARLAMEEQKSVDPISKTEQWTREMNEQLRQFVGPALGYMLAMVGSLGLIVAELTLTAGGIAASVGKFLTTRLAHFLGIGLHGGEGAVVGKMAFDSMDDILSSGGMVASAATSMGDDAASIAVRTEQTFKNIAFDIFNVVTGFLQRAITAVQTYLVSLGGVFEKFAVLLGGPVWVTVAATIGLLFSVAQAFRTGALAAEVFNVAQDKVTLSQQWAAEGAGLLIGILNTLTFGLFDCLEPTGSWTQALAKFLDVAWPISVVLQAIIMPFKILWGVLKGIYYFIENVFIGIWEGIKEAVAPIGELFIYIKDVLKETFAPLMGVGGAFNDLGGVVGILTTVLGGLGKAVGSIFKAVGMLIGAFLRLFVVVIKPMVKLLSIVLTPIVAAIASLWDGLQTLLGGLSKIITGIFELNFKDVASGIKDVVVGVLKAIPGAIFDSLMTIPTMLKDAIMSVWNWFKGWLPFGENKAEVKNNEVPKQKIEIPQFAEGTSKVAKSGLAIIHAGETIIPADINISKGTGPFNTKIFDKFASSLPKGLVDGLSSSIESVTGNVSNLPTKAIDKASTILNSLTGKLGNLITKIKSLGSMVVGSIGGQISNLAGMTSSLLSNVWGFLGKIGEKLKTKIPTIGKEQIVNLVKGAAVITLLSAGLAALSVAVVGINKLILKAAGIDSKTASETANQISELFIAASKIALATIASTAVLTLIGVALPALVPFIPALLLGAGALLLMAPVMTALAGGIVYFTQAVLSKVIDSKTASETANQINELFIAASKIVYSTLGMSAVLGSIGALTSFTPVLVPLMLLGANAISQLTPAIIALASSIVDITKNNLKDVNLDESAKLGEKVKSLLQSAQDILSSVSSIKFGLISVIPLANLMFLNAGALSFLTPAILDYKLSFINFIKNLIKSSDIDPKEGVTVADNVSKLIESTSKITNSLLKQMPKLVKLGLLSSFSSIIKRTISKGTKVFSTLSSEIVQFSQSAIKMSKDLLQGVNVSELSELSIGMEALAKLIKSTSDFTETLDEKILPLTTNGWFTGAKLDKIVEGAKAFSMGFTKVSAGIRDGVLNAISGLPDIGILNGLKNKISTLHDIVNIIPNLIKTFDNDILSMQDSGQLDSIIEKIKQFNNKFGTVLGEIKTVVQAEIQPVSTDIHGKMQQDQAGIEGGNNTESTKQLSTIISIEQSLLQETILMREELSEIKKSINGNVMSVASASGDTRLNRKPINSPNYHEFPVGRFGQSHSKNIVNIGLG